MCACATLSLAVGKFSLLQFLFSVCLVQLATGNVSGRKQAENTGKSASGGGKLYLYAGKDFGNYSLPPTSYKIRLWYGRR